MFDLHEVPFAGVVALAGLSFSFSVLHFVFPLLQPFPSFGMGQSCVVETFPRSASAAFSHPISITLVKGHSRPRKLPLAGSFALLRNSNSSTARRLSPSPSNSYEPMRDTMTPITAPFQALFLLPLLFIFALSDSDRCYFPNGQPSAGVSCWDANLGQTGLCCEVGDRCINNTLCATHFFGNNIDYYYRGSCIDPTWSDPGCPKFCVDSSQNDRKVPVDRCHDDDNEGTRWYCKREGSDSSCGPSSGYFELPGV